MKIARVGTSGFRSFVRVISSLSVLLLLPVAVFSETHYVSLDSTNPVPPFVDWATAATNIQNAIDAAADGAAVLVTNGTYLLPGTLSVAKGITLVGVNGATNTILDGSSGHFTCLSVNSANAVVDGFTITKGDINSFSGSGMGAAGVNVGGGTIQNCIIVGNNLDGIAGSGAYASGMAISGGCAHRCVVSGNSLGSVSGSRSGAAGIYCLSNGVVRDCLVSSNSLRDVSGYGGVGGVHCSYGGLVENCRIERNSIDTISGSPGYTAAGVGCSDGGVVLNCLIIGNSITGDLSGTSLPYVAGGASCCSNGIFQNCTIVSNRVWPARFSSLGGTGGIFCHDGGRVWNSIVSGNVSSNNLMIQGPLSNYTNVNNVEWAYCCTTPNPGGVGNITGSPKFVNLAAGDCHLLSGSPCIDSGASNGAPDEDLDGVPRPLDGDNDGTNSYDLGAYEFVSKHYVSPSSTNPVPPFADWATAATNIQDAINVATNDDTVLVTNGTYVLTSTVSIAAGVALRSVNGATNTVLDGNNVVFNCLLINHSNAVVEGFLVTKGSASSAAGSVATVAGVSVKAGRMQNCIIASNRIDSCSGPGARIAGLRVTGGVVRRCTVSGNTIGHISGSVGFAAGIGCSASGVLEECVVTQNTVSDSSGGEGASGVYCERGGVVRACIISGNSFLTNAGSHAAGGVLCNRGGSLKDCRVEMNVLGAGGLVSQAGGVVCTYTSNVRNCLIFGNSITGAHPFDTGSGGTSCAESGVVVNCTIASNVTYWVDKDYPDPCPGGMYCDSGGRVLNSIVYGNTISNTTSSYEHRANFVNEDGSQWEYSCTTPDPGGVGNITSDPKFVNLAAGDCHLLSNSPCIDSGSTNGAPDEDFDGVPRPLDGNNDGANAYDIGAYEFVNTNADSDADSLPDCWEVARGLDPRVATTTNGAAGNADGDTADNWSEFVADTDPQSATSVFAVAVSPDTDNCLIQFVSSGARIYSLQYAESLTSPIQWIDVAGQTNRAGAGGSMSLSDTSADEFRAYRVRVSFP